MVTMRRVLVIGSTVLLWSATGASIGGAEEPASCASPIAPCTACHSPELARELARCIAEPWPMPASAKEVKSPFPSSDKALKFGKATYDIFCEGCHGNTGDGRGPIALKHSLPSLDISSPVVQAQTDGELFWKISNGKGAMPNWGSLLPEEDRWRLVMFVRTLRRASAQ